MVGKEKEDCGSTPSRLVGSPVDQPVDPPGPIERVRGRSKPFETALDGGDIWRLPAEGHAIVSCVALQWPTSTLAVTWRAIQRSAILRQMGKTLYLLRHAKSSWEDRALVDHDRPLAPRGRRASKMIAKYLREQRSEPTLVLCSSSERTRETLERISPGLRGGGEVRVEERLYTASAAGLLERLHEVDERVNSVMVIGHYPALQELALSLASGGVDLRRLAEKFPTAGLATLALRGRWDELAPGAAELIAFVTPKELETSRPS